MQKRKSKGRTNMNGDKKDLHVESFWPIEHSKFRPVISFVLGILRPDIYLTWAPTQSWSPGVPLVSSWPLPVQCCVWAPEMAKMPSGVPEVGLGVKTKTQRVDHHSANSVKTKLSLLIWLVLETRGEVSGSHPGIWFSHRELWRLG